MNPLLILTLVAACLVVAGYVVDFVAKRAALGERLAAVGYWLLTVAALVDGAYVPAVFFGILAAAATFCWWRNGGGRGGRRAARELGAKSGARLLAMLGRIKKPAAQVRAPAGGAR